jgi:hypothetical protein
MIAPSPPTRESALGARQPVVGAVSPAQPHHEWVSSREWRRVMDKVRDHPFNRDRWHLRLNTRNQ